MALQTISQISKTFNLSTRALRYYEQIGLIRSEKKEDYAYRVYSEDTVRKLQQIVILRKLRISLKQISEILQNENTEVLIEAFRKNLSEIDGEITALSTIRDIMSNFILRLNESTKSNIRLNIIDDADLLEAVDSLVIQRGSIKEDKTTDDLNLADEKLSQLTDRDVRIIYLPPMTVASILSIGQDVNGNHAEYTSGVILDNFIQTTNLFAVYPAARIFGFNNPDGIPDEDPMHGYERWVSIPDNMEVPLPLVKKHLDGGMYAAHVIFEGAWDEGWLPLHSWVLNSKNFDFRWETVPGLCGWLEEHLNYWEWNNKCFEKVNQIDLLMPIQPRVLNS